MLFKYQTLLFTIYNVIIFVYSLDIFCITKFEICVIRISFMFRWNKSCNNFNIYLFRPIIGKKVLEMELINFWSSLKVVDGYKALINRKCFNKLTIDLILIWAVLNFKVKQLGWMACSIEIKVSIHIFIIGIQYL